MVAELRQAGKRKGSVEKLLVDVLKECSRQLDNSHPAHRSGDAPVIVQLIHTVARPPRPIPVLASANPPALDVAPQPASDPSAVS